MSISSFSFLSFCESYIAQVGTIMPVTLNKSKKSELLQHFHCGICLESVHEAQLCPHCSHVFCRRCIRTWIDKGSGSCPNCQKSGPNVCWWVKGYVINQIQESVRQLFSSMEEENDGLWCKEHENQQLSLFCYLCEENICVKCWFSEDHAEHKERTVPIEQAVEHFQRNLKTSVHWVNERKEVLDGILKKIHDDERQCSEERDLVEDLCEKSKTLVTDTSNPVMLTKILQTDRAISELRADHHHKTKEMRIDRLRDFVPEPTVLIFRMENFTETIQSETEYEVRVEDRHGCEWRCSIEKCDESNENDSEDDESDESTEDDENTEDDESVDNKEQSEYNKLDKSDKGDRFFVWLTLIRGKPSEYSVVYGNEQEKIYRFEQYKMIEIGAFEPDKQAEQDVQEVRVEINQSIADRLEHLQEYIGRLEKEKVEYDALKKYLSNWESHIKPSSGC